MPQFEVRRQTNKALGKTRWAVIQVMYGTGPSAAPLDGVMSAWRYKWQAENARQSLIRAWHRANGWTTDPKETP